MPCRSDQVIRVGNAQQVSDPRAVFNPGAIFPQDFPRFIDGCSDRVPGNKNTPGLLEKRFVTDASAVLLKKDIQNAGNLRPEFLDGSVARETSIRDVEAEWSEPNRVDTGIVLCVNQSRTNRY